MSHHLSRPPRPIRRTHHLGWPLALALLAGCAGSPQRVILLPEADGSPSAVVLQTSSAQQVLDQHYAVGTIASDGRITPGTTTAEAVRAAFPLLLDLHPAPAQRFTLNFETGTSRLTAESTARLSEVMQAARARPGGEIVVVGHTDRQGSLEANDRLSLERAQAIRTLLIEQGFTADRVEAQGRGEREPLVPTDDEVAEPRNRRAEVLVR